MSDTESHELSGAEVPPAVKPIELTPEQLAAVDRIRKCSGHIVLTGEAGSGKSTIIHHLRDRLGYAVCATTGRAALAVQGPTVDSMFCFSRDDWSIWSEEYLNRVMSSVHDKIVIDEGSMIGRQMGNVLFKIAEAYRKRLVIVGDWAQARPVKDEWITLSKLFEGLDVIRLKDNHRQSGDADFRRVLNSMRLGRVTPDVIDYFRAREGVVDENDDECLRMFATNAKCDAYNQMRFWQRVSDLSLPTVEMNATFTDTRRGNNVQARSKKFIEKLLEDSPFAHQTPISVGSRVIITMNDHDMGVVNGDIGTVAQIICTDGKELSERHPRSAEPAVISIELDRGRTVNLPRVGREVFSPVGAPQHQLTGFPLTLGWAGTVHRAQGLSVDRAYFDMATLLRFPDQLSRHGLAYVAMSRTRTGAGLTISRFLPEVVVCDPAIEILL